MRKTIPQTRPVLGPSRVAACGRGARARLQEPGLGEWRWPGTFKWSSHIQGDKP